MIRAYLISRTLVLTFFFWLATTILEHTCSLQKNAKSYLKVVDWILWHFLHLDLLRDHPLKAVGKFSRFLTLTPLRRQFFTTIRRQIWSILTPPPLRNADVLNGWFLNWSLFGNIGHCYKMRYLGDLSTVELLTTSNHWPQWFTLSTNEQ